MPSISGNVSVAANAQSANLLAGESFEFLPRPARVTVYMTGSAAGLEGTVLVGGRASVLNADVAATNRTPLRLEDGLVATAGVGGDRLFMTALNTTAGALTARWIVDIDFL